MIWIRFSVLCFVLCCGIQPAFAANRIELQGVTAERKDNIELYLASIEPAQINKSARLKNRVYRGIKQALRGLGYYQVLVEFTDGTDDKDYVLTAKITANKYVFIQTADLRFYGDAVKDPLFVELQRKEAPRQGERMHHGKYAAYKKSLLNLAYRNGYFDAKFTTAELIVTPGDRRGTMRLFFDSGQRYRFGEIQISGGQIRPQKLQELVPFQNGDFYSAQLLGELNQQLATTQWFSSIDINADPDARKDGIIPISITLIPAVRHSIETGVGYVTDLGPRLKASWDRPWLNDLGHSFASDLELSAPEQALETRYKIPLKNVTNDYYQILLGIKNRDLLDTHSEEVQLKAERQWLLDNGWYRNISVRWVYEDYIQGGQNDVASLVLPGISYKLTSDSGGSMPLKADQMSVTVEVANKIWGSDTDFIRLRGRTGWIGSWSDDRRWLVRLDAGAILQEEVSHIPPSLRFFAGGDNSLRGYAYQSVAPRNQLNELIGGSRLLTANLEYQQRVKGDWWLAVFTDYGSAWVDKPDWQQSIGLGVRWASPIGPIRLDLGYALDPDINGKFRLHFTLGPEL